MADWQWLWKRIKPMIGVLLLAIVLNLLDMLSLLGITGVQKWLIDDVFVAGQYGLLIQYLLILLSLVVGYNAVHLFSFMRNHANAYRLQKNLTIELMDYFYRMRTRKYHSERVGSMVQRITGDAAEVTGYVSDFLPRGITNIVQVLVLSVFIGWAHPVLLVVIYVLSLVLVWTGKHFGPKLKKAGREVQEAKADLLVQVEEGIASTREVIAFQRQQWEQDKYNRSFRRFFAKVMEEGKLQNKQLAGSESFRWGMNLIVLAYGAYLAIIGQISIGTFVVVYQFASQLLGGIQGVYDFVMNASAKGGSIARLREFIDDTEADGTIPFTQEIRDIQFCNVVFRYSEESPLVLNGLSLALPADKKIALVGSSGGGKSTVAQLLERFYVPSSGDILINGQPLKDLLLSDWRGKVSLVPQEPYFFPDTIRNNLVLGRDGITEEDLAAACQAAEIHELIEGMPDGYDTLLGERGITLSGGQRQRLAIARSLLGNPEVLILDEATSALDLETERRVQMNLDRLRAGTTTIVIAHRLSTVENADLICVFDQGKVAEQGTHEQLLERDSLYSRLVHAEATMRNALRA